MGKPRDTARCTNTLGPYNRKGSARQSHLDISDVGDGNHGVGISRSLSRSNSSNSLHSNSSRHGTVKVLHKTSKTSSSSSLGVKSGGRVIKRTHSKKTSAPRHVSVPIEETCWREFTGMIPDDQLDLEGIFGRDPNIWGYLESTNTAVVQSKILTRSAVGPAKAIRPQDDHRYAYLIGSGPTCDIRVPAGGVVEPNHCMIYHRLEIQNNEEDNLILLHDRSNKGVWVNNVRTEKHEYKLKNDDIISFKASEESEPYLSFRIRLPTYFKHVKDIFKEGIYAYYRIHERIGSGSFGEVFRAECKASGNFVALKKITQETYVGKPRTLQSLLQEIAVHTSLQRHPAIVRMERILEVNGVFYIAMELGKDGDLFDHICSIPNPLTEDEVRIIFDQIFHAVEYIHNQDIAHRDLKLENIILKDKKDLRVKVADFGLATFWRGNPLHTMCGTQSYAAPELVLEKECNYGKEVDIWSLGVMLFLTLVKTPPFHDASTYPPTAEQQRAMLQRIKTADYNFERAEKWGTISDLAKDLIDKMLVAEPKERYTIQQVLRHPWLQEIESPRTYLKGYKRCPELVEYLEHQKKNEHVVVGVGGSVTPPPHDGAFIHSAPSSRPPPPTAHTIPTAAAASPPSPAQSIIASSGSNEPTSPLAIPTTTPPSPIPLGQVATSSSSSSSFSAFNQ